MSSHGLPRARCLICYRVVPVFYPLNEGPWFYGEHWRIRFVPWLCLGSGTPVPSTEFRRGVV